MKILAPCNLEAEKAVIGCALIDNHIIGPVMAILSHDDFFNENFRVIWSTIVDMVKHFEAVDVVTVGSHLGKLGDGNRDLLVECCNTAQVIGNAEHYAKIVKARSIERKVIHSARDLAETQDPSHLEKIRALIVEKEGLNGSQVFDYSLHLSGVVDQIIDTTKVKNVFTHFASIDRAWNGCHGGEINTWGAATNVGKSLTLLNLMDKAATANKRCLYVGTEMSALETLRRHLSMGSGIEPWKIRKGDLGLDGLTKLTDEMANRLCKLQIAILDDPEPTIERIEMVAARFKAEIVFLDYLERFSLPREENLRLRIKEFMRRLKTMARRLDVVVHLAVQLNRNSYGEEKPPTMAEISESSAVEKESDRVVLLWTPKAKNQIEGCGHRIIEAIQTKNRHGARGIRFDLRLDETNLRITEEL